MFDKLISRIARNLDKLDIPYMIIGGQAVLLYGSPRLTKDIDITLGVSVARLSDVVRLCKISRLKILPDKYREFVESTFVLPAADPASGIRVDFIFSFTPYEQQAIKRTNIVQIGATDVRFASVEDVIIHKIFAGRPRDMEDVKDIMLKNVKINKKYIRKWLSEFDRASGEKQFVALFEKLIDN